MKYKFALVVLFLVTTNLPTAGTFALAQTTMTPEATVRSFYEWYLHTLNQNQEPLEKHQAELRKFVTRRLIKSLNRALRSPEGIDADFFIDAQDWDKTWEKNIYATKARVQGPRATTTVTLKGESFGNHRLRVGLRKEGGVWKIDTVNGRANP
jgi:tRNA U38,U39,U40 pseudouridine synthase TruA